MQMIYVVGSISHAMRGKRLLEQNGIRSVVHRVKSDGKSGCGYGLLVTGHREEALEALRAGGVTVIRVQGV